MISERNFVQTSLSVCSLSLSSLGASRIFLKKRSLDRARPGELVFKVIASKASNYLVVEISNE